MLLRQARRGLWHACTKNSLPFFKLLQGKR